jgi:hypothetical protein
MPRQSQPSLRNIKIFSKNTNAATNDQHRKLHNSLKFREVCDLMQVILAAISLRLFGCWIA